MKGIIFNKTLFLQLQK